MTLPFRVMGVVNVTPDSFSDGGLFLDAEAAIAHARELVGEGADILDVGGESTRPGAEPVSRRGGAAPGAAGDRGDASPRRVGARVSIDTSKASVARAAHRRPARALVNDVSALRGDPEMAGLVAEQRRGVLSDAHARRAAHDAGRAALRGRRGRRAGLPGGAPGSFAVREGVREERDHARPGHRLRQDARAQPRAAAPARTS